MVSEAHVDAIRNNNQTGTMGMIDLEIEFSAES